MGHRVDRAIVLAAFVAFGVFWGAWGSALPQIQRSARVDSGTLGADLLLIGVGAFCSMRVAGTLLDRLGPLVLPGSMVMLALAGVLPALARSGVMLGTALFLVGIGSGAFDVAINTASARTEEVSGRPVMNLAHASFSIGVGATSLSVGWALARGATPFVVLGCGAGVICLVAVAVGVALTQGTTSQGAAIPSPAAARAGLRRRLRVPSPLLLLGSLGALAFCLEGGWQSWAALHLERTFGASPSVGSAAPATFALAAATGRLAAQRLVGRTTPRMLLRGGAAMAAAGTILATAAPSAGVALLGIAVAGLGTSVCAPTLFSLTGRVGGEANRGAAMGTVTTLGYFGFVVGPALVGLLARAFDLRVALALLSLAAAALGLLSGRVPVGDPYPTRAGSRLSRTSSD